MRDTDLWVEELPQTTAPGDLDAPSVWLVSYESTNSLRAVANTLGITYTGSAAVRLGARLPTIDVGAQAAPPSSGNTTLEVRHHDRRFVPALPDETRRPDGLYRLVLLGRQEYLYRRGAAWYHVDMAVGTYLELERSDEPVVQWRPESGEGRADIGTVFVDWGAPLPPLQARTLVLCSGFVPRFGAAGRTAAYPNVPRKVANVVAASLRQRLTIIR